MLLPSQISSASEPRKRAKFFTFCRFTYNSISWFQNIILANRACGGGIVAWKGTNLTDAPGNRYGAYISSSQIIRVSLLPLRIRELLASSD